MLPWFPYRALSPCWRRAKPSRASNPCTHDWRCAPPPTSRTGKAVALVFGCLFAGAMLGTGLESWLRVDIVPIGVSACVELGQWVLGVQLWGQHLSEPK